MRPGARLACAVALALAGQAVLVPVVAAAAPGNRHGNISSSLPGLSVAEKEAVDLGPIPPGQHLQLDLTLRERDQGALQRLLDSGGTVSSAQWATTYGPDPTQVAALRAALAAQGLSTSWSPGDVLLRLSGSAGRVEHLLHLSIHRFVLAGDVRFYAPTSTVAVPKSLRGAVMAVTGTDDYPDDQVDLTPNPNGVSPAEMTSFYDLTPLRQAGLDGSGITVMFPEWGTAPASVLAAYAQKFDLPPFDVTVETPRGPAQGDLQTEDEASLDLEVVHGLAPGARELEYVVPSPSDLPDVLETMITSNPGAILSSSIDGLSCEKSSGIRAYETAMNAVFTQAAATSPGTSIFWASGDRGAFGCLPDDNPKTEFALSVSPDADNPDVTAVGGTTAFLASNGAYFQEAAWGEPLEQWGSGGGTSTVYSQPSYQQAPGLAGGSLPGRGVPDVACDADVTISGWDIFVPPDPSQGQHGPQEGPVGGTSAATPCWAAIVALIDEDLNQLHLTPVGFANPKLYYFSVDPAGLPAAPFHQITEGGNLYYLASAGWNAATGLGSPDAAHLADDFEWYDKTH